MWVAHEQGGARERNARQKARSGRVNSRGGFRSETRARSCCCIRRIDRMMIRTCRCARLVSRASKPAAGIARRNNLAAFRIRRRPRGVRISLPTKSRGVVSCDATSSGQHSARISENTMGVSIWASASIAPATDATILSRSLKAIVSPIMTKY